MGYSVLKKIVPKMIYPDRYVHIARNQGIPLAQGTSAYSVPTSTSVPEKLYSWLCVCVWQSLTSYINFEETNILCEYHVIVSIMDDDSLRVVQNNKKNSLVFLCGL